jgi:hypothetical protein
MCLTHGVGGINIDGCRVGDEDGEFSATTTFMWNGHKSNGTSGEHGWSGWKTNSMQLLGRFPANFIHDGSDEVLELFPDSKTGGQNKQRLIKFPI